MTSPDEFEVCVLGGGPAGCSCALRLARLGARVVVVERTNHEGPRVGEDLPARATVFLRSLGVFEAFQADGHKPATGVLAHWDDGGTTERDPFFSPQGHGLHLDRARFDATLARAAETQGVTLHRGARPCSVARDERGRWLVRTRDQAGEKTLVAPFLVDATGRGSWLGRRCGARRIVRDRLVGLVGRFDEKRMDDPRLLVEATEMGWWYAAGLPRGGAVAVFLTDADLLPHSAGPMSGFWHEQLRKSPMTAAWVGDATAQMRLVSAATGLLTPCQGPGWVAVGDAAASHDPLSSRGIEMALATGTAAAVAIGMGGQGAFTEYEGRLRVDFQRYLDQRREHYGRVRRWSGSPFWKRRQDAAWVIA